MSLPADTAPRSYSLLTSNLICMASMMIWAAALPAAEVLIRPVPPIMPPLSLTAARMTMAALFLLPVWIAVEGLDALRRTNWLRGLMVGSLIGVGALFLVMGQPRTTAVMAAVVSSAMPLVGITIEILLGGRKLNPGVRGGLGRNSAGLISVCWRCSVSGCWRFHRCCGSARWGNWGLPCHRCTST